MWKYVQEVYTYREGTIVVRGRIIIGGRIEYQDTIFQSMEHLFASARLVKTFS